VYLLPQHDIIQQGDSLVVSGSFPLIGWMDCNTGLMIPGETGEVFHPLLSGNYAAVFQPSVCADTSSCISFLLTDMDERENYFSIYPNPAMHVIHVQAGMNIGKQEVKLFNYQGQVLWNNTFTQSTTLDLSGFAEGIYFVQVDGHVQRFVLQRKD
jgi:hypothetical protein